MDSALKTMDLEKVSFGTNLYHLCLYYAFKQAYPFRFKIKQKWFVSFFLQVSALMDHFERQFENLDVQSSHMEQAMSDVTTLTVPQVS